MLEPYPIFKAAVDFDKWGQFIEAQQNYNKLEIFLENAIDEKQYSTKEEQITLNRLLVIVRLRLVALHDDGRDKRLPDADAMCVLAPVLRDLFRESHKFPLDLHKFDYQLARCSSRDVGPIEATATSETASALLLPLPCFKLDNTYLTLHVQKWGLKDAMRYVAPFVRVNVVDHHGKPIEPHQTAVASLERDDKYVSIEKEVHIQSSLEELREMGACLILEFWHQKEKYESCRCWCFLEMDEIKDGPLVLEVYKKTGKRKGADFRRKKIALFSVKPLYLHLSISSNSL